MKCKGSNFFEKSLKILYLCASVRDLPPGYWTTFTHHLTAFNSRCTFICFALSSGIPPQVVMKWTGHSDYQAMKPYIAIAEKTKADAMKLFEQKMEKE